MFTTRGLLALIILGFAPALIGGAGTWTSLGPDGGTPSQLVYDPVDPTIVYATGTGVFRSADGGLSWSAVADLQGFTIFSMAISKSHPEVVYVSVSGGFYRSSDRGLSFSLRSYQSLAAMVVHPTDPNTLFGGTGGLTRSTDGGVSWSAPLPGTPAAFLSKVVFSPTSSETLVAAFSTTPSVYRSTDGGASWELASSGFTTRVISLAFTPDGTTLYAGEYAGKLFRTVDGGTNWTVANPAIDSYWDISVSDKTPLSVIVGGQGIKRSSDGGTSWQVVGGESVFYTLAFAPGSDLTFVAGGNSILRTTNFGDTLLPSTAGFRGVTSSEFLVAGTGGGDVYLPSFRVGIFRWSAGTASWTTLGEVGAVDLAVSPSSPSTLYAGGFKGVRRSVDNGATWSDFNTGLTSSTVLLLAADPVHGAILAVAGNQIWRRAEGAAAWEPGTGLPVMRIDHLEVDASGAGAVYAAGSSPGIYRSVDGGRTFSLLSPGLTGVSLNGLSVDPNTPQHLVAAWSGGIHQSFDGGATWSPLPVPSASSSVAAVIFDSRRGRVLYAAQYGEVYRSVNGGASWVAIPSGMPQRLILTRLASSPDGRTLYGLLQTGGVWSYTFPKERLVR